MQKSAQSYTFLIKRYKKDTIKFRRVEVSKGLIRSGSLAVFFIAVFGLFGIGLVGVVSNSGLASTDQNNIMLAQLGGESAEKRQAFDYSRPTASGEVGVNSGGPASSESVGGDSSIENQLLAIETTSDPANIPSVWAHLGKINNEFGFRRNPFGGRVYEFHAGMDIDGERGDIVIAPAAGTVLKAGWQGGYGNLIEIDHGNGLTTRFGHLSKLNVEIGDRVSRGQLIAFVGSTGRSTGPHLHYELRLNDRPINPRRFLPPEPVDIARLSN